MSQTQRVPLGTKIRCFIVTLIGLCFFLPAVGLAIEALMAPDITDDDPLAILFLAFLLGGCGMILLWVSRDMYRKAKLGQKLKSDTDITAVGMAHLMNMQDMSESSGDDGFDD